MKNSLWFDLNKNLAVVISYDMPWHVGNLKSWFFNKWKVTTKHETLIRGMRILGLCIILNNPMSIRGKSK